MYPVARIVSPEEYVLLKHELTHGQISHKEFLESQRWPECDRLTDKNFAFLSAFEDVTDDDLIHHIDREIGSNRLLSRPIDHAYRPWDSYDIQIPLGNGNTTKTSRAQHYYSYWQAHQLYRLQQFTDLYRNRWFIGQLSDDQKRKCGYNGLTDPRPFATFLSLSSRFDALSFWITVYDRERDRTFAGVAEHHRVKTLSSTAADEYVQRLECAANITLKRFQLTVDDLYKFLDDLLHLLENYRRDERFKLYGDLRRDIFSLAGFIECATGQDFDAIGAELSNHSSYEQIFRICISQQRNVMKLGRSANMYWRTAIAGY